LIEGETITVNGKGNREWWYEELRRSFKRSLLSC
jgi:hypothetical protein